MLLLFQALALAALPLEPGPGVNLVRCESATLSDPCWADAAVLDRFGPLPGGRSEPRTDVTVRLARTEAELLVDVELPDGLVLELLWLPDPDLQDPKSGARGEFFTLETDGLHALPWQSPPGEGEDAALRVQTVERLAERVEVLPWSPAGLGDPSVAVPVLAARSSVRGDAAMLRVSDEQLRIEVGPSDRWELVQALPGLRWGGAYAEDLALDPWERGGTGPGEVDWPIEPGRYELRVHEDGDGALSVYRLEVPERSAPMALDAGLVPAPRHARLDRGSLRLGSGLTLCGDPAVAGLLSRELARTSGVTLPVDAHCSGPGTLQLGGTGPVRQPAWRDEALAGPQGFYVEVSADRAVVHGADTLALSYGALALSDLLADGSAPVGEWADWADLPNRFVFWRVDGGSGDRPSPETVADFVERVVLRSRANHLALMVRGALDYATVEGLGDRPGNWTPDELRQIATHARSLGLEVAPGTNTPGHADWLTQLDPGFEEDGHLTELCTRHPVAYGLLEQAWTELLDLFGNPAQVHLGHDEAKWKTAQVVVPGRCPRCSGTPRWQLYLEDLTHALDFFSSRGVTVMTWDDMWVYGHNGRLGRTDRLPELVTAAQKDQLVLQSWAVVGDPVGVLADAGVEHWRGATAYDDHNRKDLSRALDLGIRGEGVALFWPTPWSAEGITAPDRQRRYHFTTVLVSGWTGWRTALEERSITEVLQTVAHHPAAQAGRRTRFVGRGRPLVLPTPRGGPFPAVVHADEVRFLPREPWSVPEAPTALPASGRLAGLSLLLTLDADQDAVRAWWDASARDRRLEGLPAARLHVRWEDGTEAEVPLTPGVDAWRRDQDLLLWGSTVPVTDARGEVWARWDWANPRPQVPVAEVTLQRLPDAEHALTVAAATAFPAR